jgi:hypothetical protein
MTKGKTLADFHQPSIEVPDKTLEDSHSIAIMLPKRIIQSEGRLSRGL